MWKSITLVTLTLFAAQLRAEPELKGSPAELAVYLTGVPKLVSITGEAELKVPADRAFISLRVVTENKSLQEASRANQEIRARILRTLAEQGIPNERVKPSKFSSTPKYGIFGEKAKSYKVENTVKITTQDEKEFQAVANLVDAISEVRYDSIAVDHSDKDGLKAKALTQALEKAIEKKRMHEEKLGVKLTTKGFSEGVVVPVVTLGRAYYGKGQSSQAYSSRTAAQPNVTVEETGDIEVPPSFGELIYKAQITIEYALESK